MNQQERAYLMKRIDEESKTKLYDAKALVKTTDAVVLTPQQRYEALKTGKFKVAKSRGTPGSYAYCNYVERGITGVEDIRQVIIFEGEKPQVVDDKKYNEVVDMINNDIKNIKDQIMLGSSDQALKMLKDFCDKKYW